MAGSLKVNISSDETSAVAQVDSTTKGQLVPRMTTTQRDAISSPADGLIIWNTTTTQLEEYTGATWRAVGTGATLDASAVTYTPTVATDWDGDADPGDLDDALDQLAERVDDLEGIAPATAGLVIMAKDWWPSTTSGCAALAQVEYGTNDVDLNHLDFDKTADEFAQATVWMPDNWNAGTITAKFLWTSAGGTPAETVVWAIQGRSYADDDAIDQAWGTAQSVSDALIATGDMHVSSATAAVTLAGTPTAGQPVQLRIYRDTSEDNMDSDARLIGVKVSYTVA